MGMFLRRGPAPGIPIGSLAVGRTIKHIASVPREFLIVHQGLPGDIYDASCDGTWLWMKNVFDQRQYNTSASGNYANSSINTWLNGDFYALLDSNIQNAIKQVKIPYCVGDGGDPVMSGADGLSCKIFLLGGFEVGSAQLSTSKYFPIDGAILSYFSDTASTDSKRIGYLDGSATKWWLRSMYTYYSAGVWIINEEGAARGEARGTYAYGIRPAFILPSDFLVTDDMLA